MDDIIYLNGESHSAMNFLGTNSCQTICTKNAASGQWALVVAWDIGGEIIEKEYSAATYCDVHRVAAEDGLKNSMGCFKREWRKS